MYELTIKDQFASAHFLREYNGPCEKLHGHTYFIEVTVISDCLNSLGLVADFRDLKEKLKVFLGHLDHVCLNDIPFFRQHNPSTEHIARYAYKELTSSFSPLKIKQVRIWESDCASVVYYE